MEELNYREAKKRAETLPEGTKPTRVSINQEKVIKDKYLRDAPTIDAWLMGVAANIALAEIINDPNVPEDKLFKDVHYTKEVTDTQGRKTTTYFLHRGLTKYSERKENFEKFMQNCYLLSQDPKFNERFTAWKNKFYYLLNSWEFLPGSPTLMNAGRDLQQLSSCYVLPVGDSIEEIYEAVKNMALVHKSGGGTGFSFSRLRPANDTVKTTKGISSGPLSFMQLFDKSTEVVKQGGTRRGANMGILRYDHPNIMDFIEMKTKPGVMENFNVSVAIDGKFMQAVKDDSEIELINPNGKAVSGKIRAKKIWDAMIKHAWESGDPGYLVFDRINESNSNPTPALGEIEATNPCVSGDTLIATERGLMRMSDVVEHYSEGGLSIATDTRVPIEIKCQNGSSVYMEQNQQQRIRFDGITRAFTTGIKETYKIITTSGYELDCTGDHKLFTNEGWVAVTELDPSTHVVFIQSGEGRFATEKALPFPVQNTFVGQNGRTYEHHFPHQWSEELGLVLGWLVGDGWVRKGKNYRVGFTFGNHDAEALNTIKPILNGYYGQPIQEVKRENGVHHLSYHSKYFVDYFEKLGVSTHRAGEKMVPEMIYSAPREAVIGFLKGLFSSDGTMNFREDKSSYVRLTSKSERLLKGVQQLLLNLGMKSTIYNRSRPPRTPFSYTTNGGERRSYETDGVCYELNLSRTNVTTFLATIGFIGEKNSEKIKEFAQKDYYQERYEERIKSITPTGPQRVYDLTEPRTLSFIANGFVSLDCGEQPLLPNEPCNLGSVNLAKFIKKDRSDFDWEYLRQQCHVATRFLDNVIDVNNFPLPEIEDISKGNRRIGFGVMGLAESLVMLKLPYNSSKAYEKAEQVMKFINDASKEASHKLAKERGPFPNFTNSIYDKSGQHFRGEDLLLRNSARTTIAPTGTIAIAAGLQGSGIEPFFAIVYTRYNAAGIDALKGGRSPEEKDTFYEVNPLFESLAEQNNYWGLQKETLWKKIDSNHKAVKGVPEIPQAVQELFLTSHDLSPMDHVKMQVAFQKQTDNAVSKTVNLRKEATVDDVREVYELAYQLGAKGVTIYRDGSKMFQILNLEKKEAKKKKRLGQGESSAYYEIDTGYGSLHIHINYDEEGPTKIFTNISPLGTEISGLTAALGILISKYLETGGQAQNLLRHLNGIKGDKPFGFGPNKVDSIPHGISKALKDHLIKTGFIELPNGQHMLAENQTKLVVEAKSDQEYCSKCYSTNVGYVNGCSEPTCFDCGYSKCS